MNDIKGPGTTDEETSTSKALAPTVVGATDTLRGSRGDIPPTVVGATEIMMLPLDLNQA